MFGLGMLAWMPVWIGGAPWEECKGPLSAGSSAKSWNGNNIDVPGLI